MPWQNIAEVFFMSKKAKRTFIILVFTLLALGLILYFLMADDKEKSVSDAVFVSNEVPINIERSF